MMPFRKHLSNAQDLVTPYEQTRAGFVRMALERSRRATPFVEEARTLQTLTKQIASPLELMGRAALRGSLLTAAGVSGKAAGHFAESDKEVAAEAFVDEFLVPAGADFRDELVFRFLLTKGDALGGAMRNLVGKFGERRLIRTIASVLNLEGCAFLWLDTRAKKWIAGDAEDPDLEENLGAIAWARSDQPRLLLFNVNVPLVKKNVDMVLLRAEPSDVKTKQGRKVVLDDTERYVALGELKGGIDPAGADEHWKTARSALERIRESFDGADAAPTLFFVGAAIADAMAEEIWVNLQAGRLTNGANLTDDAQTVSLVEWLLHI